MNQVSCTIVYQAATADSSRLETRPAATHTRSTSSVSNVLKIHASKLAIRQRRSDVSVGCARAYISPVAAEAANAPCVLVGTKSDLRGDEAAIERATTARTRFVTPDEAVEAANQMNCTTYIECSALTMDGLNGVFEEVARAALNGRASSSGKNGKSKKRKCAIQ